MEDSTGPFYEEKHLMRKKQTYLKKDKGEF
jgi:hypothetical protein